MANNTVQQSKRRAVVIAPETTIGTPIDKNTIDTAGVILPGVSAADININPFGRGTGIISRAAVGDAYSGGLTAVPGSAAYTLDLSCEIHEVTQTDKLPYFAKLLLASGMSSSLGTVDSTGPTYFNFVPSNAAIAGYGTDDYTDKAACALTAYVLDYNDGVDETYHQCHGTVGTFSLVCTQNEIVKLNFSGKGLLPEVTPRVVKFAGVTPLSATGSYDTGATGMPYTFIKSNATLTDITSTNTISLENLDGITLNSNTNVPDITDPQSYNGHGVSPVFWDDYPTVSMGFAVTSESDVQAMENWIRGNQYSLNYSILGTSRKLTVNIPYMQATNITLGSNNGPRTYSVEFAVIRNVDDFTYPFQIIYEDL